jgi:hypothetical protein
MNINLFKRLLAINTGMLISFLRSRAWFYSRPSAALSLHELFPHAVPSEVFECEQQVQEAQAGLWHVGYARPMRCKLGSDCASQLAAHEPLWAQQLEAAGKGAFIEVWHSAYATWLGWESAPRSWLDFADSACRYRRCEPLGAAGLWFTAAPGSGIFYRAGRTLAAPTKISMLSRLLERWLSAGTPGGSGLWRELRIFGCEPSAFLDSLRVVEGGLRTCRHAFAPVPHCYDDVYGSLGDSWTLMDDYDFVICALGRALGFDSLVFTAPVRPDKINRTVNKGEFYSSMDLGHGELVDLDLGGSKSLSISGYHGRTR